MQDLCNIAVNICKLHFFLISLQMSGFGLVIGAEVILQAEM